jgi:hypothetical protein
MLIFCMLLALSGTTDFPGSRQEIVSPPGAVSTAPGHTHPGTAEAVASVVSPPEGSEPNAREGISHEVRQEGEARNGPILLFGGICVGAWVLLSFKLFVGSKS